MTWQTYKTGETIFREGDQSDAAYLIVSGEVRIVTGHDTANPRELALIGAGEYVGEMGAIDDQPRSASALAQGSVVCMPVTPPEFIAMLRQNPDEAIGLLKVLFERLRVASKKLAQMEQSGAA